MWLYDKVTSPDDTDGLANSVDPDQTARSQLNAFLHATPSLKPHGYIDWLEYNASNHARRSNYIMM